MPGQKLLLLNPNSSTDLAPIFKQWSSDKWRGLIGRLQTSYPGALMVMTGAPSEVKYVEDIISLLPSEKRAQVRNSAGMFSLPELMALFSFGDIFITIDSGPMHLAALTDIPIVGLIFAGMPVLDGPLSKNARVVSPQLYSLPTWTVYTGKESLLLPPSGVIAESVSVDEVFASAQSLLQAHLLKNLI
jgi:ADP-heptose:LPS heptosyltransferase